MFEVLSVAANADKFNMTTSWDWDLTRDTFWMFVLTGIGMGGAVLFLIRGTQNINNRIELYKQGLDLFSDNLFWGHGVGSFDAFTSKSYPHNMVIELLCELGAVFTLFFFIVMVVPFFLAAYKNRVDSLVLIALLLFTMLQFSFSTLNFMDILIPLSAIAFFKAKAKEEIIGNY